MYVCIACLMLHDVVHQSRVRLDTSRGGRAATLGPWLARLDRMWTLTHTHTLPLSGPPRRKKWEELEFPNALISSNPVPLILIQTYFYFHHHGTCCGKLCSHSGTCGLCYYVIHCVYRAATPTNYYLTVRRTINRFYEMSKRQWKKCLSQLLEAQPENVCHFQFCLKNNWNNELIIVADFFLCRSINLMISALTV